MGLGGLGLVMGALRAAPAWRRSGSFWVLDYAGGCRGEASDNKMVEVIHSYSSGSLSAR
jgi:hypothetical protein